MNHMQDFPDVFEEISKQNGHYQISDVYETKFNFQVKIDEAHFHEDEQAGVISFPINMSGQESQTILGIRKGSLQAFWITDTVRRAVNGTNNELEFVNIRAQDDSLLKIELCFEIASEAASHLEFEFKVK